MIVQSYIIYIILSLILTVWVGHTLHRKGRIFLLENFRNNIPLADSVNHLLLVGFYLINFGFVSLALKYGEKPATMEQMFEFLSTKIGLVIVVLGVMHFFNIGILIKFRSFKLFDQIAPQE